MSKVIQEQKHDTHKVIVQSDIIKYLFLIQLDLNEADCSFSVFKY